MRQFLIVSLTKSLMQGIFNKQVIIIIPIKLHK